MKKFLLVILVFSTLLSLFSCSKKQEEEFVLNVCISAEPESIDPSLAATIAAMTYDMHMFEGLVKYEIDGSFANNSNNLNKTKLVCGQASSYDVSDDKLTYTFYLRDDIYWSDGKPVTANDFVFSWRRLVDPKTAASYGNLLNGVVVNASAIQNSEKDVSALGVSAINDKTLQVKLETPCSYFLEICAYSCLCPLREDVVTNSSDWTSPEKIVVNGNYKPSEWKHDLSLSMIKNENYYDVDKLGPDKIIWWLSDNESAIISAYQTNEYQFVGKVPLDLFNSLVESGDCFTAPLLSTNYIYFNTEEISDWRIRAALSICIDRDNIAKNITMGSEVPATGWLSKGLTSSNGTDYSQGGAGNGMMIEALSEMYPDYDLTSYAGRCQLAQHLYNQAITDGAWDANQVIRYSYNSANVHRMVAEACTADWQNILGVKAVLENQEASTYVSFLGEGDFDIARLKWSSNYNDPISQLEVLTSSSPYNFGKYKSTSYDDIVKTAKQLENGAERDALVYQAEKMLFGESGFPICPLLYGSNVYCVKSMYSNIGHITMGTYYFAYTKASK